MHLFHRTQAASAKKEKKINMHESFVHVYIRNVNKLLHVHLFIQHSSTLKQDQVKVFVFSETYRYIIHMFEDRFMIFRQSEFHRPTPTDEIQNNRGPV